MSKTNEELKAEGHNRATRRIVLGINKKDFGIVKQAMHNPIPSWRSNAWKMIRNV
jgi:hypothetical protein